MIGMKFTFNSESLNPSLIRFLTLSFSLLDPRLEEAGWLLLNDDPGLRMMEVMEVMEVIMEVIRGPGRDPDQHPVRSGV